MAENSCFLSLSRCKSSISIIIIFVFKRNTMEWMWYSQIYSNKVQLQIRFNWEFSFEIRALQLTWWELWKCTFKRADYMHWRLGSWRLFHFRSHCTNAQRAVSALRKLICGLIQQKCPYIQNQTICLFLDLKWFDTQLIKRPFKLKIRKVSVIPTRPWMWNKKRGL